RLAPLPGLLVGLGDPAAFLAGLDPVPELLIDDPQLGDVGDDPFGFRVRAGLTLAGAWLLYETLPVPDQTPDVDLIVQNAGPALGIAVDGGFVPGPAARAGHAFLIQLVSDAVRRHSVRIGREDVLHDGGLIRIDLAITAPDLAILGQAAQDGIAIGIAAAGFASLDAAAQSASGLGGKVLQ